MGQKTLLAAAVSTALLLTGCLGQQQDSGSNDNAKQNADAKDVTLTITSN